MISNSCKNSNQYTVVDSFIDIGVGLVLSMWFVLAILYLTLETNDAIVSYRCQGLLTNSIHGKAANS